MRHNSALWLRYGSLSRSSEGGRALYFTASERCSLMLAIGDKAAAQQQQQATTGFAFCCFLVTPLRF